MIFFDTLLIVLISATFGFFLGRVKEFRENKHNAYSNILPGIIKSYFTRQDFEFNKSIILSWLYSSKRVAKKIDKVASIMTKPNHSSEEIINELQNLTVEMRKDIQPFPWQRLQAKDVKHIYMMFEEENKKSKKE